MFKRVSFVLALMAVIGGIGLSGSADAANEKPKPTFETADKNGNGSISLKEARDQGYSKYQFFAQDVNQDGSLTKDDWRYISRRSNFILGEYK